MICRAFAGVALVTIAIAFSACATHDALKRGEPAAPTLADSEPREFPGLHQVVAYGDGYFSGAAPEGEEAFASLKRMGVRTIISVDGATPDVVRARAHGLRYIHLPIGYDGFDRVRSLELARASQDAMKRGKVYVHCHHGKHRSAGAAGTVAVNMGWLNSEAALERMRVSQTSPKYTGLFQCVANARPIPLHELAKVENDFPEVQRPRAIVAGMVDADHVYELLAQIQKAGWKTPDDHPDLVPIAEAGRLSDLCRVMADEVSSDLTNEAKAELRKTSQLAQRLEALLEIDSVEIEEADTTFRAIGASCNNCHQQHRDTPAKR